MEEHFARPDWIERHQEWLNEVTNIIPFMNQAVAFEQVYKQSNEAFGNWPFAT